MYKTCVHVYYHNLESKLLHCLYICVFTYQTEHMLQAAESAVGPYIWGQYDLLVLPPSFPYGGMENPCLTFVTPTLLVGTSTCIGSVV